MADEKILDKVNKLLAKAEDKATTEAEAEAFFAKAYELMAQHAIDEAMVRNAANVQEKIVNLFISIPTTYFISDIDLLATVANANGCKTLRRSAPGRGRFGGILIGFESDVQRAQLLYGQLLVHLTRVCKQTKPPTSLFGEPLSRNETAIYLRSIRFGFSQRIRERFAEVKRATERAAEAHTPGTGLVLASRQDQVERHVRDMGVRNARRTSVWSTREGEQAGRRAADSADLGQTRLGERRALGH